MANRPDAKSQLLREHGTLNPRPQLVSDGLFQDSDFFDPRDLSLVKYEMLRRVRREELTIAAWAGSYSVRPTRNARLDGGMD